MDDTRDEASGIQESSQGEHGASAGVQPVEIADAVAEPARPGVKEAAEHIRAASRAAVLTDPAVFSGEPFSLTEEELAQVMEDLSQDEYVDIVRTTDERNGAVYLHSTTFLTVSYATHLIRAQADDPAYLIVQTVRDNAEIYPKPTSLEFFEFEPFSLSRDDIRTHVTSILADEACADIKTVTVSNAMDYLYSDKFLTANQALAMAQWVEVDMYLNSNQ